MAYNYDALYAKEKDALGAPFPEFTSFFENLSSDHLKVLDIGCGQGRDAVFIARAGHAVTAVDLSATGIADIAATATAEDLPIHAIEADIVTYDPSDTFDIIVIDRTLHMLSDSDQSKVLIRLLDHVAPQGWLLIADEKNNMPRFRSIFSAHATNWTITKDAQGFLFAQRD